MRTYVRVTCPNCGKLAKKDAGTPGWSELTGVTIDKEVASLCTKCAVITNAGFRVIANRRFVHKAYDGAKNTVCGISPWWSLPPLRQATAEEEKKLHRCRKCFPLRAKS